MQMQESFGARGLVVVGVTNANRGRAETFTHQYRVSYPVLAEAREVFSAFGVVWIPAHYLIDPEGQVVASDLNQAEEVLRRELGG